VRRCRHADVAWLLERRQVAGATPDVLRYSRRRWLFAASDIPSHNRSAGRLVEPFPARRSPIISGCDWIGRRHPGSSRPHGDVMLTMLISDQYNYLAVAVLLLAILFGTFTGRAVASAGGPSLAWTRVPLIAFAIASIGPSVLAVVIWLAYKSGVVPPPSSGYRFSTFIADMPFQFAVMNWGFVALYLVCRLWPHLGSARSAMGLSVAAMALPNVMLFALAPEMVANVRDAGQGIGVVQAMLSWPLIALFWDGPYPGFFDAGFGIGFVISALTAPIPFLGLMGWLAGRAIGGTRNAQAKAAGRP
jgi:hypothetical protein